MSKVKAVYSDAYEVDIGAHVFPTVKFRLIRERLLKDRLITEDDCVLAPEASSEEILLVHTKEYLDKLDNGTLSLQEIFTLEIPYSPALVRAARYCVGGTILAAKLALETSACAHIGGGFHHAFADHGEGFCVLNDVACAATFCNKKKGIEKIIIVDCDLHQGNANAHIFKKNKNIFTFSIHQENNYPVLKPPSDLDLGLADKTDDQRYLAALENNLPGIFAEFKPQLVFYIAGADPYEKDQLGGLALSIAGLEKRDEYVLSLARESGACCCVVFGGGYAQDIEDTVLIQYNTIKKAIEIFN
ncbi:MAG: histone deacetylase [Candidatus Omnitrophica bacterium]|nr:histone deacetylase [Candidatus Omnitrophota bacterium]